MVRPLLHEELGTKVLRRVPENCLDIEALYEPLNTLARQGQRPRDILNSLSSLLTTLSQIEGVEAGKVLDDIIESIQNKM